MFVKQIADGLESLGHDLRYAVSDRRAGSGQARAAPRGLCAAGALLPAGRGLRALPRAGRSRRRGRRLGRARAARRDRARTAATFATSGRSRGGAATRFAIRRSSTVIAVSDYLGRACARVPRRTAACASSTPESTWSGSAAATRPRRGAPSAGRESRCSTSASPPSTSGRTSQARRRLRRPRRWKPRLRRRRAAAPGARRPSRRPGRRADSARAGRRLDRGVRRPLPAEPRRAVRPGPPRGNGERAVGRRDRGRGPPEFVSEEAGVLVDPTSTEAIEIGLRRRRAAEFNPAARAAAAEHDVRRQVERVAAVLEAAAQ